ncbi:MAG: iron-sulfur cluster assembly scaffold protein [Epsilonproteobacteria bacterium]|nr:iron-sulfur cluster assembly scaffold protein [Campylobacterota bacterium]
MLEGVEVPEGMNVEVLEHLMNPQNYGKLDDANGIGVAVDEKTGEYTIMYVRIEGTHIEDIRFATNGCQDTVVVGSMFTEMIKDKDTDYAQKAIKKLYEKLGNKMTQKQQICADMVFTSFIAALKNHDNLLDGKEEEAHILKMKESCDTGEENE